MSTFIDFIKNKALADKVPFGIDFEITPPSSSAAVEEIEGMIFPKFNDLLAREQWFFDALADVVSPRVGTSTMLYKQLAADLIDRIAGITDPAILEELYPEADGNYKDQRLSLKKAADYILKPPPLLADSEAYYDFTVENTDSFISLNDALMLAENPSSVNWLKITFFIKSRVDGNWSHSSTGGLPTSVIEKIADFITLEANNGVPVALNEPNQEKDSQEPKPEVGKDTAVE